MSLKGAAYDEALFLAHVNELSAVVCDIADCVLTHHSSPGVVILSVTLALKSPISKVKLCLGMSSSPACREL